MPALERIVDDLVALARIPAPTFGEHDRIAWLEQRLSRASGSRERDAVGNLVWRWGDGPPRVVLLAHVDTVFEATVPHEPVREGDALVGAGVGDNAAAVAIALAVVEELLPTVALEPGALVFTVGEEGLGNLLGARHACRTLRPQAVVAIEGHGLEHVIVDAIGSVRASVTARGPGGHSWADRGAPSAVHALLELGARLVGLGTPDAPVNVGWIRGGGAVNAIAAEAVMLVERRALDEPLLEAFATELVRLATGSPLEVAIEIVGRREAGRLPRDARLLAATRAVRDGLGLPDVLAAGSTDANAAHALGIPALTIGVTNGSGMHTPLERIELGPLALGARQLELLLRRL